MPCIMHHHKKKIHYSTERIDTSHICFWQGNATHDTTPILLWYSACMLPLSRFDVRHADKFAKVAASVLSPNGFPRVSVCSRALCVFHIDRLLPIYIQLEDKPRNPVSDIELLGFWHEPGSCKVHCHHSFLLTCSLRAILRASLIFLHKHANQQKGKKLLFASLLLRCHTMSCPCARRTCR